MEYLAMNAQGVRINHIEYGFVNDKIFIQFPHCDEEYVVDLLFDGEYAYFEFGGTTYNLDDFVKM